MQSITTSLTVRGKKYFLKFSLRFQQSLVILKSLPVCCGTAWPFAGRSASGRRVRTVLELTANSLSSLSARDRLVRRSFRHVAGKMTADESTDDFQTV